MSMFCIICSSCKVRRKLEALLTAFQGTAASQDHKYLISINMLSPALRIFLNCVNKDQC